MSKEIISIVTHTNDEFTQVFVIHNDFILDRYEQPEKPEPELYDECFKFLTIGYALGLGKGKEVEDIDSYYNRKFMFPKMMIKSDKQILEDDEFLRLYHEKLTKLTLNKIHPKPELEVDHE